MRLTRDWVLLGGLVARYAIGLLFSKGYFERIEPVVRVFPHHSGLEKFHLRETEFLYICDSAPWC